MLDVICFKWHTPGYKTTFTGEHVNILQSMVARHYREPHRFICYTNEPEGIDASVIVRPLWDDLRYIPNPTGGGRPSCYLRLKMFAPEVQADLSERFVWLDLDCIILDDLRPLWNRPEPIVLWQNPRKLWPYNGAMLMARNGAHPELWSDFDPESSPSIAQSRGYHGSDQGWISLCLGPNMPVWTADDGVLYWSCIPPNRRSHKPDGARIVLTTSDNPPWDLDAQWVKENYR